MKAPGAIAYALAFAALGALAGCQAVDPPEAQTFLHLRLNDSLARCERVQVLVFDRDDTARAPQELWNGPLAAPQTQIPAHDMKAFGTNRLLIVVKGFKAGGQLAVQTRIFYAPGEPRAVLHDPLPPLVPQNWLLSLVPSLGELAPPFHRDSVLYQVKMPQGKSALTFTPTAPYSGVTIQVNGKTVPSGAATDPLQIGQTPDTVFVRVTDTSTGGSFTRDYQVVVFPTLPEGVYLDSLIPSTGRLSSVFTPEQTVYNLYMFPGEDTVSFRAYPRTPSSMTVTIDGLAVFPGQQSPVITVAKGATRTVPIRVRRGSDVGYYQITLDHTQSSSH
jgi:hypothetical protein